MSLFQAFREKGFVAISFGIPEDLSRVRDELEEFERIFDTHHPQARSKTRRTSKQRQSYVRQQARQLRDFVHGMTPDDSVIAYGGNRNGRIYLKGRIEGYNYDPSLLPGTGYLHVRLVKWAGTFLRDALSLGTRDALGIPPTVFKIPLIAEREILSKNP